MNNNAPEIYKDLSENVFQNAQKANAAAQAFIDEVYQLRIKYRIADVHVITAVGFMRGKKRLRSVSSTHMGYSLMKGKMLLSSLVNHVDEMTNTLEELATMDGDK